jgi:hypothetical protein
MWGMTKDKVYSNSPHTEDDQKQILQDAVFSVSPGELALAMNMFIRCVCKTLEHISGSCFKYGG